MKEISDVQLLFCLYNKKTENLDFQDFPASVTGDERIELRILSLFRLYFLHFLVYKLITRDYL